MTDQATAAPYHGTVPFTVSGPAARHRPGPGRRDGRVRGRAVAGPGAAVWLAWGHGRDLAGILLAAAFYVITGLGVTAGFHRLLTPRSFTAAPALRNALAIAGSMSLEGEVIGWFAIHRRHHALTGRPGDPHSPYRYGSSLAGQLRGLAHARTGWRPRGDPTPPARYAPDMLADPAMRALSAAFPPGALRPWPCRWLPGGRSAAPGAPPWPPCCGRGWCATPCCSTSPRASTRCATSGTRPFATGRYDRATSLWPLAPVSFGESWHNMHHSDPACARHGAAPGQVDISAAVIRIFGRLGWAAKVRWPTPAHLDSRHPEGAR
jgi:stearoyl-CoA desaturase (Delta-9 desaturase)